ncbi:MAG: PP2C family protein-serine/threonine phosphatase [Bacteroidota bacterium]
MIKKTSRSIRDFYDVFTTGLSIKEIERLVNVEAKGSYEFYLRSVKPEAQQKNSVKRFLVFCWNMFLAFLLKLTPARRLFYAIAVFSLLYAWFQSDLSYAVLGVVILNFLLALEVADKMITKDELELAREIQLSLLPGTISPPGGYDLSAHSEVAKNVGGDYYDLIPLGDGSSLAVIGDVSGKGISAALYMVKVQTALQLIAKDSSNPKELLIRLNRHLYGQLKKNYFLTIAVVQLYPDGRFRYCRAGHTPAIFYQPLERHWSRLQPGGAALGLAPSGVQTEVMSDYAGANGANGDHHYEAMVDIHEGTMQTGDVLFLYTDGLIEGVDSGQQEFGEQRTGDIIARNAHVSAEGIKTLMIQELSAFRANAELRDDTTFFVIKRIP